MSNQDYNEEIELRVSELEAQIQSLEQEIIGLENACALKDVAVASMKNQMNAWRARWEGTSEAQRERAEKMRDRLQDWSAVNVPADSIDRYIRENLKGIGDSSYISKKKPYDYIREVAKQENIAIITATQQKHEDQFLDQFDVSLEKKIRDMDEERILRENMPTPPWNWHHPRR